MRLLLMSTAMACLTLQSAYGAFDLQVTEMWPGNEPGDNQTSDWFEVTNVGDMDWTTADGTLYFDDSSPDVMNADEMFGIETIAAGESVIFVDDDLGIPAVSIGTWTALWTDPLISAGKSIPQIGYYAGSGLSGGGDEVNLWLDTDTDLRLSDIIDTEAFVNGDSFGGQSWDSVNGQYTTASYGVVTGANADGNPSTGTPGFAPVVPEPTSLALAAFGSVAVLLSFRRK